MSIEKFPKFITYFYLVGSPTKNNELLFTDYVVIDPGGSLEAYPSVEFQVGRFPLGSWFTTGWDEHLFVIRTTNNKRNRSKYLFFI